MKTVNTLWFKIRKLLAGFITSPSYKQVDFLQIIWTINYLNVINYVIGWVIRSNSKNIPTFCLHKNFDLNRTLIMKMNEDSWFDYVLSWMRDSIRDQKLNNSIKYLPFSSFIVSFLEFFFLLANLAIHVFMLWLCLWSIRTNSFYYLTFM